MRIFRPQTTKPIPRDATINSEEKIVIYKGRDKKPRRAVLTDSGRMRVTCGTWHVEFKDHLDREQRLAAYKHERQTRLLANQLDRLLAFHGEALPIDLKDYCDKLPSRILSALQECGLLESEQTPLGKPLSDLLGTYEQQLRAKERNDLYVRQTVKDVTKVFTACGFHLWRDIKDGQVEAYLRDLRQGERHLSYRRSNAYLVACQGFANWIVNDRAWALRSPLRQLKRLDDKQDPRHPRRALAVEQLRTLLQRTADEPERYGMSGWERCLLYWFASVTGLRAGEIRRLRTSDFDFENNKVIVRPMRASKNKIRCELPITRDLCRELCVLMQSKTVDSSAFGGSYKALTKKMADMLKYDLKAAGIPYKDARGEFFDFHALRHEASTLWSYSGADSKTLLDVMRTKNLEQHLETYGKILGPTKTSEALSRLPTLCPPGIKKRDGQTEKDIAA